MRQFLLQKRTYSFEAPLHYCVVKLRCFALHWRDVRRPEKSEACALDLCGAIADADSRPLAIAIGVMQFLRHTGFLRQLGAKCFPY